MKFFGTIRELSRIFWREDGFEVSLDANSATTYTADRNGQLPPGDQDSTLVGETNTQTLTNKTLTSPVVNSPTGITKADVGLGNVDNTSDATKNAAAATLTNKTLTAPVINSPTGIVKADVGLGNVDNTSDATKNAAAVTLTNKTLTAPLQSSFEDFTEIASPATPASGTVRLYAKADGTMYSKDDAGTETPLGSAGSSSSAQNLFLNSGFDLISRGSGVSLAPSALKYVLDRWFAQSTFDAPGAVDFNSRAGEVDGSSRGLELVSATSPTTPASNAGFLYQTLDNKTSLRLYNQNASFSAQFRALGNVTQISVSIVYAVTEVKAGIPFSAEVDFPVNSATYSLCQIINEALGTVATLDGVVGVRIRASAVSSGAVSDAGNGFRMEQAGLYVGNPPAQWSRQYPDIVAERAACDWFFESSYTNGSAPGTAVADGGYMTFSPDVNGGVDVYGPTRPSRKRTTPTVTVWAPDGTVDFVKHYKSGGASVNQAVSYVKITDRGFVLRSPNSGTIMEFDFTADAEI